MANVYAPIVASVSGGWLGCPGKPRSGFMPTALPSCERLHLAEVERRRRRASRPAAPSRAAARRAATSRRPRRTGRTPVPAWVDSQSTRSPGRRARSAAASSSALPMPPPRRSPRTASRTISAAVLPVLGLGAHHLHRPDDVAVLERREQHPPLGIEPRRRVEPRLARVLARQRAAQAERHVRRVRIEQQLRQLVRGGAHLVGRELHDLHAQKYLGAKQGYESADRGRRRPATCARSPAAPAARISSTRSS